MNMKTIKYLGMLLAMLAMSVSFVSCSSDDDDEDGGGNSSSVVGTWWCVDECDEITAKFNANGTGTIVSVCTEDDETDKISFEWEQEGNEVWAWTEYDEEFEGRLSGNTLTVEDEDGYKLKFKRK